MDDVDDMDDEIHGADVIDEIDRDGEIDRGEATGPSPEPASSPWSISRFPEA